MKEKTIFQSFEHIIEVILENIVTLMFVVLIVSCVVQVFMRSIVNISPPWTEELARYSFMYVNIIAAAICVQKKSHARVTAILDALPLTARQILEIFSDVVILFVSYIMIRYGIKCVIQVVTQRSPAMRICMSFVYACIPLSGVCIATTGLISLIRDFQMLKRKEREH